MPTHNLCGLCKIELKDLSVKIGKDILLEKINLDFHCGELTVLIGRNGAGKTTLLKALLGERIFQGQIQFIRHDSSVVTRPLTGYVPQKLDFDKSTPISVLDFMLAAKSRRPVWFGIQKKEKQDIKIRLAQMECENILNRRLGELSGGELQRVLLAMAVDPLPDLLILDEPVSGVDLNGLDLFYHMVAKLRDEHHIAIILVSHDLSLIRKYADKVVLLDKTIAAQGETKDVFDTKAFQSIFGYLS